MKLKEPFSLLCLLLLLTFSILQFGSEATLPQSEWDALKEIAKTLGKEDWNFKADPCNDWTTFNPEKGKENNVTCDCTIANDNFCHVVSIILKEQNLPGKLPPELVKLPYLYEIDLTRNYLNGSIPPSWGSLKLVNISLLGNRLTGPIPKELGNISTLRSLVLEFNQFTGNLSHELGNLTKLERLFLTSNNFTGELPPTFAKLTSLKDVRLGDNQFSGKIPSFIGSWTNLETLIIEGSGLTGPIPSEISQLKSLSTLRINDLNESDSTFPGLDDLKQMKILILRSCNINDKLPDYLGYMTNLKILDLSFNRLHGRIPDTFGRLGQLDYLYLTGNLLHGPVPKLSDKIQNIDLSYNNFTSEISDKENCQQGKVNMFGDSIVANNSRPASCMRGVSCSKFSYSLHINCGGNQETIGPATYDEDSFESGAASFISISPNWAFSNTGHFLDASSNNNYIVENKSRLSMPNPELYMNARVSPSSLTYYGFCLGNGPYTVFLHFAEIMFTDDQTFSSLGRRVFHVYIQGKLMLKDFNIANEAGGVNKEVRRNFTVNVTTNTLEIRFYWAGKGTTAIPQKSVYGPLISAISVNPNFKPPKEVRSITGGVVGAIVATGVIVVFLILGIFWWICSWTKKSSLARELKDLELQTGVFTLRQIKAATNNFDGSNKIGEGGFGPVFKGFLSDGKIIAVKQLSSKSKQGNREFLNEIGVISALQHPCLVRLYGCCVEGDQLLLVYEYMENNSLARALFGREECRLELDWPTRRKICIDIARGLAFLHEESRLKIVHRDIKATNVLLDKNLNAKISDFGLAKLDEEDNTHISTRIAGTYGYMAPEYAMHGYLTDKADVYSFGIVALEIVSGRSNSIPRQKDDSFNLLNWAHVLKSNGYLNELVDRRLGSNFDQEEVMVMINVAFLCTHPSSSCRPTMSSVLSMLEGKTVVPELNSDKNEETNMMKLEEMRQYYRDIEESQMSEADNHNHTKSLLGPSTGSSTSAADLYPIRLDSSFWDGRN